MVCVQREENEKDDFMNLNPIEEQTRLGAFHQSRMFELQS